MNSFVPRSFKATYDFWQHAHARTHTHTHTHTNTCTHTHTRTHTYKHTHTYVHTHGQTHTNTHTRSLSHTRIHIPTHSLVAPRTNGLWAGLFLFSTPGRMMRPVMQLHSGRHEWIGTFEQVCERESLYVCARGGCYGCEESLCGWVSG